MKEKCKFHRPANLGYMAFFTDAEKRSSKGEKQKRCPHCKYWFWPYEFGIDPNVKSKMVQK